MQEMKLWFLENCPHEKKELQGKNQKISKKQQQKKPTAPLPYITPC